MLHARSFYNSLIFLLKHSKTSLLGALSSAFEWYDYALFGYFAAVLAQLFFPATDPKTALLSSFAVFASGFIMRPIGAILFGYIGDFLGRRRALMLSLMLMALPTTLLGLMPTFDTIGIWATYGLVALRLLQGLAVGGNYGGSFIVTIENAPKEHQSLAGSLATFGTLGGLFLGSGAALLATTFLNEAQLYSFGWRIPFLLGGLSTAVAYSIRRYVPEDQPSIQKNSLEPNKKLPIQEILKHQLSNTMKAIGIIMIDGVGIYLALVFMTTYATTFLGLPSSDILFISTGAMALLVFCIPVFGHLGDQLGARKLLRYVALGLLFVSLPLYILLATYPSVLLFALLQIVFSLLISAAYGTLPVTVVGIFPKHVRYTATGLAFNISVAAFGGTAPLVVTYLIQETGILWMPGVALTLVGIISSLSLCKLKENYLYE